MAMDRFFLAVMVASVLLILAADLLVNGHGRQEPASVANILPAAPARLVR